MRGTWLGSVVLTLLAGVLFAAHSPAGENKVQASSGTKKDAKAEGGGQKIEDELTADDPVDKVTKMPHKVHPFKAVAGKTYKIEMHNADGGKLDPFLRLEDARGKQLGMDDDGAGFPNARLIFRAPADGEYRVIATAFPSGKEKPAGKYTVTIAPLNWKKFLAEQLKPLREKGADVTAKDAYGSLGFAMGLEDGNPELAAEAYTAIGKALAGATDEQVGKVAKMMQGAARRMELNGKPIDVHGQTLEGKPFDWKAYKGKVVLVDFWATWCGPCRAEIPNMKRLYEAYHDRGFDVVAITIDKGKDAPTKYMEAQKLPWVCLFDPQPGKGLAPLADYYGIFAIPRAILVDREGRVVSMSARGPELQRLLEKELGPMGKGKEKDESNPK